MNALSPAAMSLTYACFAAGAWKSVSMADMKWIVFGIGLSKFYESKYDVPYGIVG